MTIKIIGPDDPALAAARNNIAANPDWNLELEVIPWAQYRDILMDTLHSQLSPHQAVFVPGHVWIPELAAAGLIAELDSLIADLPEKSWHDYQWDTVVKAIKHESKYLDQQFMIPYFNDGQILFYKKDVFRPGKSRDLPEVSPLELLNLAEEFHNPPDHYGIALKAHPSEILFDWLPYLFAAGGKLADQEMSPAFVSEAGVKALTIYCKLRDYAPPETHTFGNEEIADVLKKGQAALVATWGGQAAPIFLDQENSFREKYLAAVFPHPCGATWGISLPANQSRDGQLNTLQVLLMLNRPSADLDVLIAAGSPVRETSYTEQAFGKYSWLKAQYEILNRFAFLPFDPRAALYLGPLTEALVNAFHGSSSPEKSLKEAEKQILKNLNNYNL